MRPIQEVAAVTSSDRELLSELKQIVLRHLPTATLPLYGSAARGEREPDSDYDVLVLTEERLSTQEEDEIRGAIYDLQLERGVVIPLFFDSWGRWNSLLS